MGIVGGAIGLGQTARAMATLARWLGPWADQRRAPDAVARRTVSVPRASAPGGAPFDAWLYTPARKPVRGAYAIAPGMHFDGPADPRMDRLCRVLARAGFLVIAPFVPDFLELRNTPGAVDDFERALDVLVAQPEFPAGARPRLFSISFGSRLALRVAASEPYAARLGDVIVFGGYLDWREVLHFCMHGGEEEEAPYDPLNRPVVFINLLEPLLDILGLPASAGPLLHDAWLRFVRATWSRYDREREPDYRPVAEDLAQAIEPDGVRELFLMGCGLRPGGPALCAHALARHDPAYLELRPHLARIRCPVHVAHGADDDVIPVSQAHALAQALPAHASRLYITGVYGHTLSQGLRPSAPVLAREIGTLVRLLHVLAHAGERNDHDHGQG